MVLYSCYSVLQCVAVCCNVLQCVTVCYSVLQFENVYLSISFLSLAASHSLASFLIFVAVFCSVLQCVAVCCSVLQCVAVCCSVMQCDMSTYSYYRLALAGRDCRLEKCARTPFLGREERYCTQVLFQSATAQVPLSEENITGETHSCGCIDGILIKVCTFVSRYS